MLLRTSKPQLKSIFPPLICSQRSILRIRSRDSQNVLACFPARAAATKSFRKVLPVRKPAVPQKPASSVVHHGLAPNAAEVRDARRNLQAQDLAGSGKGMLFQAQSHAGYMFTGWIGGIICFAGAFAILNQRLYEENEELHWTVPVGYRLSAIFLVGLSGWAVARSSRRISSIEILPGKNKARLILNVRRNIPLPFIKPRSMNVLASHVTLQRRVITPMGRPPQDARSSGNSDESFVLGIARSISTVPYRFFAGARQFIFSDGIIKVSIEGHGGTWKLDGNGRFLDGGARLFDIVKFED